MIAHEKTSDVRADCAPQPIHTCHNHFVQFYKNSEYLAVSIAEYLRLGLESGEAALVIARPIHWARVKALLIGQGTNVDKLIAEHLITYVNAVSLAIEITRHGQPERASFRDSIFSSIAEATSVTAKIRCYGEVVDILSSQNRLSEAMTIEAFWNEILEQNTNIELMCGYQASNLEKKAGSDDFQDISKLHTNVIEVENIHFDKDEDAIFRKIAVLEQRSAALKHHVDAKRRIDEELASTKAQLLQVGKLTILGELCAGIAHELNNPLAIIKGSVIHTRCILDRSSKPIPATVVDDTLERLEIIDDAASRMAKIVNKVLLFARQQPQTFSPYSITRAIHKALDLFQKDLESAHVQVYTEFSDETLMSFGDTDLVVQVFLNIMANARDAIESSNRGDAKILHIKAVPIGKKEIEVSLNDNGIGMDEQTLAKVFYPFFTTKEIGKGTGLGLSISHGIIADHKGKITCESTVGEGTTFRIYLPRAEAQQCI